MRKHIYSKKGVGTALGAVFFIGIVILSLTALITISSYQMKYLQTRDKMIEWDIKRMSENIAIVNLIQPSTKPGYTFDLIVNNTGEVLVKIVRIYIYDNKTNGLFIFDRQASGGNGFINGEIMPGEGNHAINVKAQNPLANDPPYRYRIIACTERGRQFSFSYPKPELPPSIIGGINPRHIGYLVITFNEKSLMYTAYPDPVITTPAWENIKNGAKHVVWHLNITNLGNKDIKLLKESKLIVMYNKKSGGGISLSVLDVWYISAPPLSVPPGWNYKDNPDGIPGYDETTNPIVIKPNSWKWVALGAAELGQPSYYFPPRRPLIPDLELKGDALDNVVWIFLELHYKYGDEYYSQVIPFAAIAIRM